MARGTSQECEDSFGFFYGFLFPPPGQDKDYLTLPGEVRLNERQPQDVILAYLLLRKIGNVGLDCRCFVFNMEIIMKKYFFRMILSLMVMIGMCSLGTSQEHNHEQNQEKDRDRWLWQQPEMVMDVIGVKEGMVLADIGCFLH